MDALQNYKTKLTEIQKLIQKLENGELQIDELSDLERLTREIHERSIILRYKAYEKKKVGASDMPVEEKIVEVEEEVKEEPVSAPVESVEEGGFDFELFGNEDNEDIQNAPEEPIIEIAEVEAAEVVEEIVREDVIEEVIETVEPQNIIEEVEESLPIEEPTPVTENVSGFVNTVRIPSDALDHFSVVKINSLIGAFGLNDRLRFINELFDGSSEKFGDAIKSLDTYDSMEAASSKIDIIASENEWDPEEEAVQEFIIVLKRRYA